MSELRHYPRRNPFGSMEIVDRQFDFIRAVLPYDYRYTSNGQQWSEAERICQALEGPMQARGVMKCVPVEAVSVTETVTEPEWAPDTEKGPWPDTRMAAKT